MRSTAPLAAGAAAPLPRATALRPLTWWTFAGLAVWLSVQVVLPLRHRLYDGDVLWTQEGMRWAWHVMVAERGAVAELTAVDADGRRWVIDAGRTLTPLQERMMAAEPDLLLQFAREVRDDFAARGRVVRVHADVWVAVNGRPSHRLVDPDVDLAAEPDTLLGYDWLLAEGR